MLLSMTFHQWYLEHYQSRWEFLYTALLQPPKMYEFSEGLKRPYYLDEASLEAARALEVQPGDAVLDACAAPGGKTLVLALQLGGTGLLIANDRSSSRRARLHRVLQDHLEDQERSVIRVTGHDASRWGLYEQNRYDRILLDAPCSSERHVLQEPRELNRWGAGRTKRLALQQFAMVAAALEAVKPGGRIVYSTCALSPLENDGVMAKLLKKRPGASLLSKPEGIPWGEPTEHGWIILPDRAEGRGPMYIAVITKREEP